ncbi:MAG: hypothetical protein GY774_05125 [Planctomycetes bacterium]|nr:hypothetical protein [Planctomycetota bacterium]
MKKQEKEYYSEIKAKLVDLLKTKTTNFHLEITANKKFSDKLTAEIREGSDIIFRFLKEASPDITGFIKNKYSSEFIVVEFKKEKIKLDNIYQTKKYRELFNAKFTFLISLKPIPTEIIRLDKAMNNQLLMAGLHWAYAFILVEYDKKENKFVRWYPKNPFESDIYWK